MAHQENYLPLIDKSNFPYYNIHMSEKKSPLIECMHCGHMRKKGAICPVCKKSNLLRLTASENVITSVEAVQGFYNGAQEPAPPQYKCPFCGSRKVREIVFHSDGTYSFYYNMETKNAPDQDKWSSLKDISYAGARCADCDFALPREDFLSFIEESEDWLTQ